MVKVRPRILDGVTEGEECLPCGFGQSLPKLWRRHDRDAGDLSADMRVVPIDPEAATTQALRRGEP